MDSPLLQICHNILLRLQPRCVLKTQPVSASPTPIWPKYGKIVLFMFFIILSTKMAGLSFMQVNGAVPVDAVGFQGPPILLKQSAPHGLSLRSGLIIAREKKYHALTIPN